MSEMTVRTVADSLGLQVAAGASKLDNVVRGGYASDLLSCVMAGAHKGDAWVTLQAHMNVVAVATLALVRFPPPPRGEHTATGSLRADIAAGWRYLRERGQALLVLILTARCATGLPVNCPTMALRETPTSSG